MTWPFDAGLGLSMEYIVFHAQTKSCVEWDIDALLVHHEQVKKREYGERTVNVDRIIQNTDYLYIACLNVFL